MLPFKKDCQQGQLSLYLPSQLGPPPGVLCLLLPQLCLGEEGGNG